MSDKPPHSIAKILETLVSQQRAPSPAVLEMYLRTFPRTPLDQPRNDMPATSPPQKSLSTFDTS